MTDRLQTLAEIESAVWRELAATARDKAHAWRTPVLATVDGDAADARVIVLREVAQDEKRLLFYTDERTAKVLQLRSHPCGTVVMWSAALGWQLRCRVRLTLETSGLAATSRWAKIRQTAAAREYLSPVPPGTALAEVPHQNSGAVSRAHFAVIEAAIDSLDWLELHPDGNRRAVFDAAGARWLQP